MKLLDLLQFFSVYSKGSYCYQVFTVAVLQSFKVKIIMIFYSVRYGTEVSHGQSMNV